MIKDDCFWSLIFGVIIAHVSIKTIAWSLGMRNLTFEVLIRFSFLFIFGLACFACNDDKNKGENSEQAAFQEADEKETKKKESSSEDEDEEGEAEPDKVRLLLVMDTSFSMRDEYEKAGRAILDFVPELSDLPLEIIVTIAGAEQDCYSGKIAEEDSDREEQLKDTLIQIAQDGFRFRRYTERPFLSIEQTINCLEEEEPSDGKAPPTAILIVSDADNCSDFRRAGNNGVCESGELDGSDLKETLSTVFEDSEVKLFGLLSSETTSGSRCRGLFNRRPDRIESFFDEMDGSSLSLCERSYDDLFDEMLEFLSK